MKNETKNIIESSLKQAEEPIEYRFNSIGEILVDPRFIHYVGTNLQILLEQRLLRPQPQKGYRYKRDWYDRLGGQLKQSDCIDNIESIWLKSSNLSSEARHIIQLICDKAFAETVLFYKKEEITNSKNK